MKNTFEGAIQVPFDGKKQNADSPKTSLVKRDWDDNDLPPNVETFSFNAKFKKYKRYNDEKDGPFFAELEGVGFSIPKEKLDSIVVSQGDEIKIEKLTSDTAYRGDGIVKISNITKGLSATIKNWDEAEGEGQEHRKAA